MSPKRMYIAAPFTQEEWEVQWPRISHGWLGFLDDGNSLCFDIREKKREGERVDRSWKNILVPFMAADAVFLYFPPGSPSLELCDLLYRLIDHKPRHGIFIGADIESDIPNYFRGLLYKLATHCNGSWSYSPFDLLYVKLNMHGLLCQSPIELAFHKAAQDVNLWLYSQFAAGPYFLDFAIPEFNIAIELDGHEYHSSKEQRTHDAGRDRYLIEDGWTVLRFTGSEIYQNVHGCIEQVQHIQKTLQSKRNLSL